MKRTVAVIGAGTLALTLAACGVSQDDHDQLQASAAAVEQDRDTLKSELSDTEAKLAQAETKLAQAETELGEFRAAEQERKKAEEAERKRKQEAQQAKEEAEKKEREQLKKAKAVSKRELAQIVKNPDAHVERNVIIYARITQFDSATGPCTFRADISHAPVGKYEYEHNSIFNAGDGLFDCEILDDVVAEDIVKLTAEIAGSLTYDTQIGGSTTVPEFQVVKLKHL